ncbi:hypothetical protein GCM10010302_52000 [Streptomyces polychromogenes]|uniref:Tetratricopeptide repeat protein n=1 Tax=Streptomyces polychromogenes TaxID=67342 RepID=A0ABP3F8U2_9ACTN
MTGHHWISAPHRAARTTLLDGLGLPPLLATVDAHRRLRGPYTAAGTLLRLVAPAALERRPELAARHYIELQESTPELAPLVPPITHHIEEQSTAGEVSRYPARLHSLRVAHGIVDFLLAALTDAAGATPGPRTLVVENVQHADVTDQEFLAAALRRIPPALLTLVLCTGTAELLDPPGFPSLSLPDALAAHTTRTAAAGTAPAPATAMGPEAVRRYVDGDCTDDDPARAAAYEALPEAARTALHDARAAVLAARAEDGEPSLRLGALPFHLVRGSDPEGAGVEALRAAMLRCKYLGFYHVAAELGDEGRRLVDPARRPDLWWIFIREAGVCLAAAGRPDESAVLQEEARMATQSPAHHMKLAYEIGMLYARHYPEERRDPRRARAWVNTAISIADLLPDPKERAFYSVFNRNGLALVEVRDGRPDEALRLLDQGIERLNRELGLGERTWHQVGLRYNRAQVNSMAGRLEAALADYGEIMDADDDFADHYFNRGNILRKLGRPQEAIADYERALSLEAPFPEAYYNRGDARLELGDTDGALADFARTLELDPDHREALLARAGLLADLGDAEGALADVTAGLAVAPGHAHLLCLRGRLLAEAGRTKEAAEALEAALDSDPGLAEAWAVKGEIAYGEGDLETAVADFDRALELADRPDFRFNRAVVHESAHRYARAAADFEAVYAATGDPDAAERRDACRRAAEHTAV